MERAIRSKQIGVKEMLVLQAELLPIMGLMMIAAFSSEQKRWIRERDHYVCQFPDPHDCNGSRRLAPEDRKNQIHHIIPQRYAEWIGIENPDYAENGLLICENSHVGEEGVHPDTAIARHQYREGDKNAYKKMFDERQRKLQNREIYWTDKWDRLFHNVAIRNTQNFLRKAGIPFPERRKRNGRER